MLTFKVQTDLSEKLSAAIGKAATKAEHIVAVQAEKDTSPYVPFLTGSLDQRTQVVGNSIIYPGPYARFLYYTLIQSTSTSYFCFFFYFCVIRHRPMSYGCRMLWR